MTYHASSRSSSSKPRWCQVISPRREPLDRRGHLGRRPPRRPRRHAIRPGTRRCATCPPPTTTHPAPGEPQARGVRREVGRRHCAGIPAESNVAISRSTAAAAATIGKRQHGAGPLAQPQVEVDQRAQAERGQRDGVAGLDAAVPGEAVVDRVGRQGLRDQGGGAGDHAVQDHRHAARPRSRGRSPASPACSKPPTVGQHLERVGGRRGRARRAAATIRDLVGQRRVVDAGAAAGDRPRRPTPVKRGDQGGGRRWCCRCPCRR